MSRPLFVTWVVLSVLSVRSVAWAQAGNQDPAPVNTISIDGGYSFGFGSNREDAGYYRVGLQGRPARERGTPFKFARSLDLLEPSPDRAGGDVPRFSFRYERDKATVGGGILESLGTEELPLPGLSGLGLRGAARLGADASFDRITAAVGLETPPMRLPGLATTGISNWLVFGINAERREATDSAATDASLVLGTFRMFVGKAIGWRKSADVGSTAGKIVEDVLELAPTRAAAVELRPRLVAIPANRRTPLQQTLLDAIPEAATDEEWVTTVEQLAFGEADAITDQPTASIYLEGSGWVDFGNDPEGSRFKSLFTASIDYWFWPSRDDILLRLRYEIGYERVDPLTRKNRILATIGIRL